MTAHTVRTAALGFALTLAAAAGTPAADDKTDDTVVLKVGDAAPAFEARTDEDKRWKSVDHFGKKWVVVYFYPGDFTPGCTAQAKAFKEGMAKLAGRGVEVVGVSGDAVQTHALFKAAQGLPFTLLADPDGDVARRFGVPLTGAGQVKTRGVPGGEVVVEREVTAARWTFLVGRDGKVAYKNTKVVPAQDAKAIAEFVVTADGK